MPEYKRDKAHCLIRREWNYLLHYRPFKRTECPFLCGEIRINARYRIRTPEDSPSQGGKRTDGNRSVHWQDYLSPMSFLFLSFVLHFFFPYFLIVVLFLPLRTHFFLSFAHFFTDIFVNSFFLNILSVFCFFLSVLFPSQSFVLSFPLSFSSFHSSIRSFHSSFFLSSFAFSPFSVIFSLTSSNIRSVICLFHFVGVF
jgi:hypothetical protein